MDRLLQRSELVHMVWKLAQKDVPGLKKSHIEAILDGLLTSMSNVLLEGREVPLGKIGVISVKQYPSKTVQDRNTGEPRELPPRKMLFITTNKAMLAALNDKKRQQPQPAESAGGEAGSEQGF